MCSSSPGGSSDVVRELMIVVLVLHNVDSSCYTIRTNGRYSGGDCGCSCGSSSLIVDVNSDSTDW